MSVSTGISVLAPLIGVAGVVLAACSPAADRPASRDTTAMTTAAAPETSTSTSRATVETSGRVTDSTTAIRTQSAGVSQTPPPKPPVRPSIDPGRKAPTSRSTQADTAGRDTTAPSNPSAAAPAPSSSDSAPAQRSTAASGQDQGLKYDAKTNTVTFQLIGGPSGFQFNGFSSGGATLTLPPSAKVVINFVNKDGTPHSAEVISGEGPLPNGSTDAAIPRAYTVKALEGLPQEGTDVMNFTVPASGTYRIFCGVPGHGLSGMWIWMKIDPAAKTPSFGATKK